MSSKKKWYERYNYDLMDQQFKVEIKKNPDFNIEENIEDLRSLRKYEMGKYWYGDDIYSHKTVLYCERTIRYWKKYKIQKEIQNNSES